MIEAIIEVIYHNLLDIMIGTCMILILFFRKQKTKLEALETKLEKNAQRQKRYCEKQENLIKQEEQLKKEINNARKSTSQE